MKISFDVNIPAGYTFDAFRHARYGDTYWTGYDWTYWSLKKESAGTYICLKKRWSYGEWIDSRKPGELYEIYWKGMWVKVVVLYDAGRNYLRDVSSFRCWTESHEIPEEHIRRP